MSIAMPGYVPDVASTDLLDPAWGDAIRDRAPQVFADTTTRDAAITAPIVGMSCYITSGSNAGHYVYSGAVVGWTKPWNDGWGNVARTVDTSAQSNADATEHVKTGAATTFTALANRKYRISVKLTFRNLAAANATITYKVKDNTTLIEQARIVSAVGTTLAGTADFVQAFDVETTLTAGSHTINLTHQSSNAAGMNTTGSQSPCVISIDDIGPSGAPS